MGHELFHVLGAFIKHISDDFYELFSSGVTRNLRNLLKAIKRAKNLISFLSYLFTYFTEQSVRVVMNVSFETQNSK